MSASHARSHLNPMQLGEEDEGGRRRRRNAWGGGRGGAAARHWGGCGDMARTCCRPTLPRRPSGWAKRTCPPPRICSAPSRPAQERRAAAGPGLAAARDGPRGEPQAAGMRLEAAGVSLTAAGTSLAAARNEPRAAGTSLDAVRRMKEPHSSMQDDR